jgi:hypothetical protein
MNTSRESKEILLEDLFYSVKMMKGSSTPEEKLFYFSGVYGALSRAINVESNPRYVLAHLVTTTAYNTILARLNAIKSGELIIKLPQGFFDKLVDASQDLIEKIKNDEDTYKALEKISVLTFLTTGNGYYLFEKGSFKI